MTTTFFTAETRRCMQARLDELIGDRPTLKFHSGDPGLHCTDNLIGGTGLPQVIDYADPGTIVVRVPEELGDPIPRNWFRRRSPRWRPRLIELRFVSLWNDKGVPLLAQKAPQGHVRVQSGDEFTLSVSRIEVGNW